jgi:hypothetical protein
MPAFAQTRTAVINADPATIHAILNDFHEWGKWSPWESKDPQLERTFTGNEQGVGAKYAWTGNKQVGSGTMEITGSTPSRIDIDLEFITPFKAKNKTVFELSPAEGGTKLSWVMSGDRNIVMTVLGKLYFDKAIAKDFDKGLASIKGLAEA